MVSCALGGEDPQVLTGVGRLGGRDSGRSRGSPMCDSLRDSGKTCLAAACGNRGLWGCLRAPQCRSKSQALDPVVFTGVFLSPIHWEQVSPLGQ